MDADGGRWLAPTGVSAPRPSSMNHHTHTHTRAHPCLQERAPPRLDTDSSQGADVLEAEFLDSPGFRTRDPGCQMGGRWAERQAGKCYGRMCIFVPDMRHHFFPPILGQKLAFCLWALEAAVNRGNTPARHRGPGNGSHVATHQRYHPPWQLAPHSPPRHAPLKA